jgi:hypothetical protein
VAAEDASNRPRFFWQNKRGITELRDAPKETNRRLLDPELAQHVDVALLG